MKAELGGLLGALEACSTILQTILVYSLSWWHYVERALHIVRAGSHKQQKSCVYRCNSRYNLLEAQCVDNIIDSAHMALYLLRVALSVLTRADEAY